MAEIWGAVVAGVIGAGASAIISSDASRKASHAVSDARTIADNVTYQPIDIAQLTKTAHDQAVANATNSLALERSLQPGVSDTRQALQQSIANQLKQGGNLPPDVVNQVTQAARVGSGSSGTLGGSSVPLTAQLLGVSALGLLNQRQQNASNLLAANPLPAAGLDPGTLAGLEAQNNAAQNQFNLAKAGVDTNLVNSQAQANAASGGVSASNYASLLGLLTKQNPGTGGVDTSLLGKLASAYGTGSNPATNPISSGNGSINYPD